MKQNEEKIIDCTKVSNSKNYSYLLLVMALILSVLVFFGRDYIKNPLPSYSTKIVYIDVTSLIDARAYQIAIEGASAQRIDFIAKLKEETDKLTMDGYFVLTARSIISAPNGSDITGELASRLGVSEFVGKSKELLSR